MNERIRFINDHLSEQWSMTELCELYEISRNTGYKWLKRYATRGLKGLAERPRTSHNNGQATAGYLMEAIIGLRRERPSWGAAKIIAELTAGQPNVNWPVRSTVDEILQRAGLANGRRLRHRAPPRLNELTVPRHANHVWQVEHTGWVRIGDGRGVEPLTIMDGFSRYLISVTATGGAAHAEAKPLFERAFLEHGLPKVIRSDDESPFSSTGATGLTSLTAWWIKLGIKHERIDPGQPRENARHEHPHLALLEAIGPIAANRSVLGRRFAKFKRDYNEERPHEALGQRPPASVYVRSPRQMPRRLPEPEYPPEVAVRKVRSNGEIKWQGHFIFTSEALVGELLAVEETEAGRWQVRFFDVPIGWIDLDNRKLRRLAAPGGRRGGRAKP